MSATAEHRPALRTRRYRHDTLTAVDLFSGFGGTTTGIQRAGFDTITAANHNRYKVEVHEANHPQTEHWIADLVDPESADYHSVRDLPPADLLAAGVSCVNHSMANTKRAYAQGLSLFDLDDPDYEAAVTRSERDRATASCVLHYAALHHPMLILVECTTELQSWGTAIPGRRKVGDGSTYRWWLREITRLGYRHRTLYLNSMFFGVPQSRDRLYEVFWDQRLPDPDLEHRPETWCPRCETAVEAVWTWRTGVPPSGVVRWGTQYDYRCPSCRHPIVPPFAPSLAALDLSDLGSRIGDRSTPLAPATMARAERCRQRFAEFPAVLMPAKATRGSERHLAEPMATQTSQQETALLTTGRILPNRTNGTSRGLPEPMETIVGNAGSGGLGLLSTGVLPFRRHTTPTTHAEAMPTVTTDQTPGLITAAGRVQCNGSLAEARYRAHPLDRPLGTAVGSAITQGLLFGGWNDPDQHTVDVALEDCHFRMLFAHEVGRGCGFDPAFPGHPGSFTVWGSARDQVNGYGNAFSPPVGEWIGSRLRTALHGTTEAA